MRSFFLTNSIFLLTKYAFAHYSPLVYKVFVHMCSVGKSILVNNDIGRKESSMTLTKAEIVKNLNSNTNFSREKCSSLVEGVFELIKEDLAEGSHVLISGFGKWFVRDKNPRKGRNPQSGTALMLDGRRVVTFKCSRKLKETLNADS